MTDIRLFDYHRSTASYRVRIALALAGVTFESVDVDLVAGEQRSTQHLRRNPQGFVPVLEIDGQRLTQSLAIITYLNDTRHLGLLPEDPATRARVQALAHTIAMDIHPVCNLSVTTYATAAKEPARTEWMRRFITPGLAAFEELLASFDQTPFCTGDTLSVADLCLIPQLYNANRWGADYTTCQRILGVEKACATHAAFVAAHPDRV